jgi:UDP-N-acetylmuramoyl-tripeptide--D-alanyl-D-alanine ligase
VAEIAAGSLHGPDATVDGAAIDSRVLRPGALFVPVVAERDGHDFIDAALAAGAGAYLTARSPSAGTAIAVADTSAALTDLGRWARGRLPGPVMGVTGSAGKTSTKDMLGAVLQPEFPTVVSERSFNNELGVPLTLFNADDGTRLAVLEMGARGFGHIAWLCEIARPDVGVVTNVAAAHIEMFGDLDGVARAKGELVAALPKTGTAVLNANDDRVMLMASRSGTFARSIAASTTSFGCRSASSRPGARRTSAWKRAACTRQPTLRRRPLLPWRSAWSSNESSPISSTLPSRRGGWRSHTRRRVRS